MPLRPEKAHGAGPCGHSSRELALAAEHVKQRLPYELGEDGVVLGWLWQALDAYQRENR